MGPPPRTNAGTFKFDVDQDYYACGNCLTDIALQSQLVEKFGHPWPAHLGNRHYLSFRDAENVVPDYEFAVEFVGWQTELGPVYCSKCSADLGYRLDKLWRQKDDLQEGWFWLYASELILWKGKMFLDAITEEPVAEETIARKMLDYVNGLAKEKIYGEQMIGLTEQLKLRLGMSEGPVERKLLDVVHEEPVEKNMPEAVSGEQEQVEENTPETVTEEQVEENTPETGTEEQAEENTPEAGTENPVDKN